MLINGIGDSGGPHGSAYVWLPGQAQPVKIADGLGMALSPDGKKAFVVAKEAPLKVSIVPTGAGESQPLDLGVYDFAQWAGWLPDGRLIVEVGRRDQANTVLMFPKAGGAPVQLLPSGIGLSAYGHNLISPDGSLIAAVDGQSQLMVCTIVTPAVCRPMPGAEGPDNVAGWSADGKAVVVYRREGGFAKVDRLDVTTGTRTHVSMIKPLEAALSGIFKVIAAPDGALGYAYARDASQLYVIKGLK
jgi:Tol biopolymer transport system component